MAPTIHTLGELKKSGYISKSIKDELRDNLIAALQSGKETFPGMHGYEQTVIPQLERAILSNTTSTYWDCVDKVKRGLLV